MNPMNRRMFRDPMMAKRVAGILASSPELMTSVQQAMAKKQPVKAATGMSANTNNVQRRTFLEDIQALPTDIKNAVVKIMQLKPGTSVDDAVRQATNIESLKNLRQSVEKTNQAKPTPGTVDQFLFGTDESQSPLQSAARTAVGPFKYLSQEIIDLPGDLGATIASALTPQSTLTEAEQLAAYRPGTVPSGQGSVPAGGVPRTDIDSDITTTGTTTTSPVSVKDSATPDTAGSAGEGSPVTQTDGKSAAELLADATARQKGDDSGATTTTGSDAGADTNGDGKKTATKVVLPDEFKEVTAESVERAPGQSLTRGFEVGFNEADAAANKVDSVLNENRPAKDVAKDNDAASGIDPNLSRSERVKQRVELYREMLGDEAVKDIRTDANYNLMMLGLRIAGGQSENAISNIAQAGAAQLSEFGTAVGEEAQAKVKQKRDLNLMAIGDVNQEMATEAAAMNAAAEAEKDRQFKWDVNKSNQAFQAATAAQNNIWSNEKLDKQITASLAEAGMNIDAAGLRQKNDAILRLALQNSQNQQQVDLALMNHEFAAQQAKEGKIFDLEKLGIAQAFAKEQGLNEQAFREKLAKLPGDTQKLYEKFLTGNQIAELLTVDKKKTDRAKYKSSFVTDVMTKGDASTNMQDSLLARFKAIPGNESFSDDQILATITPEIIAAEFSKLFDSTIWPNL